MPEVSVIQEELTIFLIIKFKGYVDGFILNIIYFKIKYFNYVILYNRTSINKKVVEFLL